MKSGLTPTNTTDGSCGKANGNTVCGNWPSGSCCSRLVHQPLQTYGTTCTLADHSSRNIAADIAATPLHIVAVDVSQEIALPAVKQQMELAVLHTKIQLANHGSEETVVVARDTAVTQALTVALAASLDLVCQTPPHQSGQAIGYKPSLPRRGMKNI